MTENLFDAQSRPGNTTGVFDPPAHIVWPVGAYIKEAPEQIKDRNGCVVLQCCKRCGRAEAELEKACTPGDGWVWWRAVPGGEKANPLPVDRETLCEFRYFGYHSTDPKHRPGPTRTLAGNRRWDHPEGHYWSILAYRSIIEEAGTQPEASVRMLEDMPREALERIAAKGPGKTTMSPDKYTSRINDLEKALNLALGYLAQLESGDSRAVSNEYVAMAGVSYKSYDDESMRIIDEAQKRLDSLGPTKSTTVLKEHVFEVIEVGKGEPMTTARHRDRDVALGWARKIVRGLANDPDYGELDIWEVHTNEIRVMLPR